jgi:hypothetical protein
MVSPMIDAISSVTYGLRASAKQFEKAVQNVAKASASRGQNDTAETGSTSDDLATAIVDTKTSELSFKANAAVFKTANKMIGTLLDTVA